VSVYGDILDELLAQGIVGGEWTTSREYTPLSSVQTMPYAYAFMRGHSAEQLEWVQEARTFEAVLVVAARDETQEAFYARVDGVVDSLYAQPNRTLNGNIDTFYVSQIVVAELERPANGKAAAITVTCQRSQ